MAAGGGDTVELEAMRAEDHSWHPCQVSLRSGSSCSDLIVDFENSNLEETISSEEDAHGRLRVRSTPLQQGDCFHFKEGQHVLAKAQFGELFFDAEVEKVLRVRHSSKVKCRCSFAVKWLHPDLKGDTVSSDSIRRLSHNSIDSHPTVVEFLKSVAPLNRSGMPLDIDVLKDKNLETDFQRLLEKKIEEIGKLVDGSNKACSEEILWGVNRVDLIEHKKRGTVIASQTSSLHGQVPENQNSFGRSTRSRSKLQIEMQHQAVPDIQPTQLEHIDCRPCLSPLAARAALASLVHQLPQKREISIYHGEEEGILEPSQNISSKQIERLSLDVTRMFMKSDVCIQGKISMTGDLSSNTLPFPVISDPIQIVNNGVFDEPVQEAKTPIFPRKGVPKLLMMGESYGRLTKQEKLSPSAKVAEDGNLDPPTQEAALVMSSRKGAPKKLPMMGQSLGKQMKQEKQSPGARISEDRKFDSPILMRRFTRSAVKGLSNSAETRMRLTPSATPKAMTKLVNEIDASKSRDGEKSCKPSTTRMTGSVVQKEKGNALDKSFEKAAKQDIPSPVTKMPDDTSFSAPTITARVTRSVAERRSGSTDISMRLTRSAIRKEIGNTVTKLEGESLIVDKKSDDPTSQTRIIHPTIQKRSRNSTNEVTLEYSAEDRKLNGLIITKRLTRSAIQVETTIQKKSRNSTSEVTLESSNEDRKLSGLTTTTRLTRSGLGREPLDSAKVGKLEPLSTLEKVNNPVSTTRLTRSALQRLEEDSVIKVENEQEMSNMVRLTRSAVERQNVDSATTVRCSSTCTELNSPASTNRLTRSAIQKGKANSVTNVEKKQEMSKLVQDAEADIPTNGSTKSKNPQKKQVSSSFDVGRAASRGTKKSPRVSNTIIVIEAGQVGAGIPSVGEGPTVKKQKLVPLEKPQLRFSHRLRFLPRTRSQKKSYPVLVMDRM